LQFLTQCFKKCLLLSLSPYLGRIDGTWCLLIMDGPYLIFIWKLESIVHTCHRHLGDQSESHLKDALREVVQFRFRYFICTKLLFYVKSRWHGPKIFISHSDVPKMVRKASIGYQQQWFRATNVSAIAVASVDYRKRYLRIMMICSSPNNGVATSMLTLSAGHQTVTSLTILCRISMARTKKNSNLIQYMHMAMCPKW